MVIDYLDAPSVALAPHETDTPLVVDANRVLAAAVTAQGLQAIAGRRAQFIEQDGRIDGRYASAMGSYWVKCTASIRMEADGLRVPLADRQEGRRLAARLGTRGVRRIDLDTQTGGRTWTVTFEPTGATPGAEIDTRDRARLRPGGQRTPRRASRPSPPPSGRWRRSVIR